MGAVPFQPREAKPGLDDALAELDQINAAIADRRRELTELSAQRSATIRKAMSLGATLKLIGARMGVSTVRVGQMRDGK